MKNLEKDIHNILIESLHPNQKKLDVNDNGKLDGDDFNKLRSQADTIKNLNKRTSQSLYRSKKKLEKIGKPVQENIMPDLVIPSKKMMDKLRSLGKEPSLTKTGITYKHDGKTKKIPVQNYNTVLSKHYEQHVKELSEEKINSIFVYPDIFKLNVQENYNIEDYIDLIKAHISEYDETKSKILANTLYENKDIDLFVQEQIEYFMNQFFNEKIVDYKYSILENTAIIEFEVKSGETINKHVFYSTINNQEKE